MKKKRIIFSVVAIAMLCGGWYGFREYNRKVKDLSKVKAELRIQASDLITAFEKSENEANTLYLDKIIAVNGTVRSVEKDDKGHFSVILGKENSLSSVRCSMDSSHQAEVSRLAAGTSVTMKGACTGFNADELIGSDVILNRCVLEK